MMYVIYLYWIDIGCGGDGEMNFGGVSDHVCKMIKNMSFMGFYLAYVLVVILAILLLDLLNGFVVQSDLMARFELGLPLLAQAFIVHAVYRGDAKNKALRMFYTITVLYTLLCAFLALYDLLFSKPSFGDGLLYYIAFAQIIFQLVLMIMLIFLQGRGRIEKGMVVKPAVWCSITVMTIFLMNSYGHAANQVMLFWTIIGILTINVFNPVLLYIMTCSAKRRCFISL